MTELTKSQRNDLFRAIEHAKMEPSAFEWAWMAGQPLGATDWQAPALRRTGTPYYFALPLIPGGGYGVVYEPGYEQRREIVSRLSWNGVYDHFSMWLLKLRDEIEQEDLWENLRSSHALATLSESDDNTPFSEPEQVRIRESLRQLQQEIHESRLFNERAIGSVDAKLDRLAAASERMGRKDWAVYALGTMTSIVLGAAFAPEQSRAFARMIATAFHWLAGGPLLP